MLGLESLVKWLAYSFIRIDNHNSGFKELILGKVVSWRSDERVHVETLIQFENPLYLFLEDLIDLEAGTIEFDLEVDVVSICYICHIANDQSEAKSLKEGV